MLAPHFDIFDIYFDPTKSPGDTGDSALQASKNSIKTRLNCWTFTVSQSLDVYTSFPMIRVSSGIFNYSYFSNGQLLIYQIYLNTAIFDSHVSYPESILMLTGSKRRLSPLGTRSKVAGQSMRVPQTGLGITLGVPIQWAYPMFMYIYIRMYILNIVIN